MKRRKKILIISIIVLSTLILSALVYKMIYSMDVAKPFEVNSPQENIHLLIATQGSDFKNQVVDQLVNKLTTNPYYLKIIDVTQLEFVNEHDWNLIIIIHTWENWSPPKEVGKFVKGVQAKNKIITLTTSGQGSYKLDNVDGITSPSKLSLVDAKADELYLQIKKRLNSLN